MTHSGIFVDVIGAGLELIPQDKLRAILAEFPRLSMKKSIRDCLCGVVAGSRPPATTTSPAGSRYAVCGGLQQLQTLPISSKMHLFQNKRMKGVA